MRKRIVIGLIAVVAAWVTIHQISQPKKGSLEWHMREYVRASERCEGLDWRSRLGRRVGVEWLHASEEEKLRLYRKIGWHTEASERLHKARVAESGK